MTANIRHHVPKSGQIWFSCADSGFYVIDLKPELRASRKLQRIPASTSKPAKH
jgi:hypothetical protein